MSPKKRHVREFPVEDQSQASGSQELTTAEANTLATYISQTTHPHTSTESHAIAIKARRPEDPTGQPSTQVEARAIDASYPNLPPTSSQQHQRHNQDLHQQTEAQGDVQQDYEGEIKTVIEDKLAHLHQENEHLRLV
jgi:hypothetical protein